MNHIVGVGAMHISNVDSDVIVTYALGSCLGVAAYDPGAKVGGLLHVMLPSSETNPEKAKANPYLFVDTGLPAFLQELTEAGAQKGRLVVKVAGGSTFHEGAGDRFLIGKRNYLMLKKVLWKQSLLVDAEDVGGQSPRTMYLEVGSGRVGLNFVGQEKAL